MEIRVENAWKPIKYSVCKSFGHEVDKCKRRMERKDNEKTRYR